MAKYKKKLIFILAICLSVLLSLTIIVNGKKWFRDFCVWYIGSYCHYYFFSDFCFSPDGNMIGTVNSSTMQPVIWDWKSKPSPDVFAIMPSDMSFSDDGKYFIAGNYIKKEIILYDISKKEIIFTHQGIRPCFSADSKKIVFFDKEDSSKITIWDIENKSQVSKFEIGTITSIEQYLKPLKNDMDKSLIVFNFSRSFAGIDICDIKDWKSLLLKLKTQNSPEIKLIRDNLDRKSQTVIKEWDYSKLLDIKSKLVIVEGINKILEMKSLYKMASEKGIEPSKTALKPVKRYPDKLHPSEILDLNRSILCKIFSNEIHEFVPEGIKIWDIEDSTCLEIIPLEPTPSDIESYKLLRYELLTAYNKIVIKDNSDSKSFIIFNLKRGKKEYFRIEKKIYFPAPALSNDGKELAFLNDKTEIIIFDLDTGKENLKILVPLVNGSRIFKLSFSPDGKYIASGSIYSGSHTGQIDIYETATGKKVKSIKPPDNKIQKILIRGLMILREK